jgi:integrase
MAIEKRKAGDGTVSWRVKVFHKGKVLTQNTFKKKTDAQKWETQQKQELNTCGLRDLSQARKVTFEEAVNLFIDEHFNYRMATNPNQAFTERFEQQKKGFGYKRNVIATEFKKFKSPLTSIRGLDLVEYRKHRQNQVSNNTIRHEFDLISLVFKFAVKEMGFEGLPNPVKAIRLPAKPKAKEKKLTPDERLLLIEEAALDTREWFKPMVEFQMWVGLRISETCNIQRSDIDLEARTIWLNHNKTDYPRHIPLSTEAVRILNSFQWGIDSVFHVKAGTAKHAFSGFKQKLLQENKLKDDLTLHDLRHEATQYYFDMVHPDGSPMLGVQHVRQITGHKSLDVMLKTYVNKPDASVVTGIPGF